MDSEMINNPAMKLFVNNSTGVHSLVNAVLFAIFLKNTEQFDRKMKTLIKLRRFQVN